jgi:hypothetical protein
MKLLPSFKSAKSLALVAVTIATAISSSVTPSQAGQTTRVISTPGQQLQVVTFDGPTQSFKIGCPELRNIWSKLPTQAVSAQEFQNTLNGTSTKLPTGELPCNSPSRVKGYVSRGLGSAVGIIMTDGKAYYIKSGEFFKAMNITPIELTTRQLQDFSNEHSELQKNTVLIPLTASGVEIPLPSTPLPDPKPQASSIAVQNLGLYVIRYEVTYNIGSTRQKFDSQDMVVGKKVVVNIPPQATNIKITARYYTGLFAQTAAFFSRDFGNSHSNQCFTTSGNLFKMKVEPFCK